MRHASAPFGIFRTAVTHLLHDQVTARFVRQVGDAQQLRKIKPVAVQVGDNHDVVGYFGTEHNDIPAPGRASAIGRSSRLAGGHDLGGTLRRDSHDYEGEYDERELRSPTGAAVIGPARSPFSEMFFRLDVSICAAES
jgi:hypothetical protein